MNLMTIPPNYDKAYEIYKKALDFEVSDKQKDEILFARKDETAIRRL